MKTSFLNLPTLVFGFSTPNYPLFKCQTLFLTKCLYLLTFLNSCLNLYFHYLIHLSTFRTLQNFKVSKVFSATRRRHMKVVTVSGFSLVHKNVHFDPFWSLMNPDTVHKRDSDVPRNSPVFLFPEVNIPQIVNTVVKMSLRRSCN